MARRNLRTVALALSLLLVVGTLFAGAASAQSARRGSAAAEPMQLNVKDVPVQEVLKLIAESGGFNIAISSGVKGRVTLYLDEIMPRDLLDIVVSIVDAAYVEENGAIWVLEKNVYESRYGEDFADHLKTRTFPLRDAAVKDVLPTMRDLLGKKVDVKADVARNMIRVKASARKLREAEELVKMLDTPKISESFQLNNVPLEIATNYLQNLLKGRADFVEDPGSQRLVVSANRTDLDKIREVLGMLDAGEGMKSQMLDIRYSEPDSLADRLRSRLTLDVGQIYADKMARKIMVVDYPSVVDEIARIVHEYDMPIRQVLLEAKIIQVSRSNEVRTGIDWSVLEDKINITNYFPALADGSNGTTVNFGDQKYDVIMDAMETYGKTNLLSSPRLVVVDGGTGYIHVGSQEPYKTTTTRMNASGITDTFEEVVVLDVGIKLEVEVRILGDDMIYMKVSPEVSSVSGEKSGVPVIDATTIESSLSVQDGNTVILGGLIEDEKRVVRKGIPLLSRIPLIKYLVSSNVEETVKSELIVLLTPRIMSGREAYEAKPLAGS